uniref:Metallothionein-like protein n=1 Tax=Oryza barthii TaxID=65489 RepID=A0A0D3H407_9ORYZ
MPAAARSLSLCPAPSPALPPRATVSAPPRATVSAPPRATASTPAAAAERCRRRPIALPPPLPAVPVAGHLRLSPSRRLHLLRRRHHVAVFGRLRSPLALLPSPECSRLCLRHRCRRRRAPSLPPPPRSAAAAVAEHCRSTVLHYCRHHRAPPLRPSLPSPTAAALPSVARTDVKEGGCCSEKRRAAPNLEGGTNPVELLAACWSSPQGRRTCDESEGRFQMEGVPSLYPQIRHPHTSTHPRFYFQRFTEDTNMEGRREGKDIVGVRAKKKYPDLEEESNSTKVTIVLDLALEKKARQFEVATNFGKTAHGCCCGSNCNCNPCNG